jgi:NADH dehydrogenase FAD-containing subunit
MPRIPESPEYVLIVGGGIAGISAIYALRRKDKKVKITLVNAKDYSELLWAAYRAPFDEGIAKGSLIRLPL